ncbi:YdcF family protein [Wenzhouxiangella sp. EGI_FJ10409]|uniref:YdcF family protein n=1 Tax=Wenzhouxiangella sp. EGI_FJ10409 TaxID=3243767 RepID=UPI0035E184F1
MSALLYPLGSACVAMLAGLLFARRRWGRTLVLVGLAWLWLWSMPVFSDLVRWQLERGYADVAVESAPVLPITVVLGGAFSTGRGTFTYPNLNHAADRYWHAARLYAADRTQILILTGGRNPRHPEATTEARAAARLLADMGVPEEGMRLEERARTTRQNAVYVEELLDELQAREFLLVTSALHMPRAEATFQRLGLAPVTVATDFEVATPFSLGPSRWLPSADALMNSSRAFHEFIGHLVYRLRGWA